MGLEQPALFHHQYDREGGQRAEEKSGGERQQRSVIVLADHGADAYTEQAGEGIEKLRVGLAAWRKTGARLWLPIFLALEAEAHAKAGHSDTALQIIEEALSISDETGERWALAEVLRIKAGLLQATGCATDDETEAMLINSLQIARRQQALCWQLRTACDLVHVWQAQGREEEGLRLLQSIHDQFTEGFATADLIRTKALLEGLRSHTFTNAAVGPLSDIIALK